MYTVAALRLTIVMRERMACHLPLKLWRGLPLPVIVLLSINATTDRIVMTPSQPPARLQLAGLIAGLLLLLAAVPLTAQPNFSFRMGGANVLLDNGQSYLGVSLGSVGKFDAFPFLRFRVELDVDKVRMEKMTSQYIQGDQSATFVSTGIGVETAVGTRDFYFFGNVIPHGTFRATTHRDLNEAGESVITDVTRFSLGVALGVGGELFLTDHMGLEGLLQYDIYNLDPYETEPRYRAIRATLGIQFYLGSNFKR
jgi:hypothetical protein